MQPYPWVFTVIDFPFGVIGCDFLAFYNFRFDVGNKRLLETERSEFEMPCLEKNGMVESANIGFENLTHRPIQPPLLTQSRKMRPDPTMHTVLNLLH